MFSKTSWGSRGLPGTSNAVITSFRHKGVKGFFETGSKAGIQAQQADRLGRQLRQLNDARRPQDMNMPGWNLHQLSGERAGRWSVRVSGNWRLVFAFEGENAANVDYVDYH
jgi:proteic killer suppression protein